MLRFRNPGTEYSTHINIMRQLYKCVCGQEYFTLDDMAIAIAEAKLMTAYGYSGEDAIRLSNTEQESMNSTKMNVKMYAELFRMLGWIAPYYENASYPLVFTYIGLHIALSKGDCKRLYEQSVLGISNPTQFDANMKYSEHVRFFKCALRTLIDLGGVMYKHELCLGSMSVNDEDEEEYQNMINRIRAIRGSYSRLNVAFSKLAESLNMQLQSVDNSTRVPVGLMKNCGWITPIHNTTLYGKSLRCFQITPQGVETYNNILSLYDLRLDKFEELDDDIKQAAIRLSTYSMLERAGYDISSVSNMVSSDIAICNKFLGGKGILFSPSAVLKRNLVEKALGIQFGQGVAKHRSVAAFESTVLNRIEQSTTRVLDLNIFSDAPKELLNKPEDREFLELVNELKQNGLSSSDIVERLFERFLDATKVNFYPLIATLFKIIGFDCSYSRAGDNGARWDAIIEDPARSIPIEIKSPTEELHISIKAIRQALENKIVLLSRRTYITTRDVTSLAIGYYMPNDRAEVCRLISDIKKVYGYRIGVIDLKSLLSIAVSVLINHRGFNKEELYNLEGLMNAHI